MRNRTNHRRENGAALVVGMILLLVLTLLAVSGMNTASTELVMAGNEQFQENAFQAAEMGIEQAMRNGTFNPGMAIETFPATVVAGTTYDNYAASITPQPGPNMPHGAMWGNRLDSFATFHFEVQSQGQSARNAQTTHTQGMFVIAPYDPGAPPPLAGGPSTFTAP
ncbi:MAG TPA: pilus assembly PilX N-terminal domain-containing protein [Steroidobacteraceae bacterium]